MTKLWIKRYVLNHNTEVLVYFNCQYTNALLFSKYKHVLFSF